MTTKTSISVEKLLEKLITSESMPTIQELSAFSDLSRADWQLVRAQWSAIPEDRRYQTLLSLVEWSYENLDLLLGRLLRIALDDASDRVRSVAIRGLWEDTEEDLIGPLIHMLHNDPSLIVRREAANALGVFILAGELEELDAAQAMRVEEALLAILHNETEPLEVQCRALESLAFSGEAGMRQLIEDAYYSPYEEMQLSALVAMGRSADTRWRATVRTELDNPAPAVRAEAARACGELDATAALGELLELLSDEDKRVRLAAIFALGRIGGKDAIEALEAMALSEDEDEIAAAELALEEASLYEEIGELPGFEEYEDDWDDEEDEDW